ncbi:MAG: 2-dehydropantoate 2-reductase N-terminal domain-containing protein [Chitinophagaceae bacterium]
MKILVYGAGVIGSIYSARLHKAGFDITLLARGKRYESLKRNGIVINDVLSRKRLVSKVPLTEILSSAIFYDLIIVTVRLDQLDSVKATLKSNAACQAIMFMLNNPDNLQQLIQEFPDKKILLGFPGVGGTCVNEQIDYVQIKEQRTTIGDIEGTITNITEEMGKNFEHAGFKVDLCKNMQAWLKTHAVFVVSVAAAISRENGNSIQLGKNRNSVQRMVKSINEGFRSCERLGMPIAPANLKMIFMTMPQWFSVCYWQKAMKGKTGTLAMAPHANAAKAEMKLLAGKVLDIVHTSSVATPTLDNLLLNFINSK